MNPATSTADLPAQPESLRACPFCHAPAVLDWNQSRTGYYVLCGNAACLYGPEPTCDLRTPEAAVAAWQGVA